MPSSLFILSEKSLNLSNLFWKETDSFLLKNSSFHLSLKVFLYSSPEFWTTFFGFFCCCQNVVQKKQPLIETLYFFSISRLVLKSYSPKNLLDRCGKAYKIFSEIWKVQFYFPHAAWTWCSLKCLTRICLKFSDP